MGAPTNFAFLAVHDAALVRLCEQAQGYFRDDPSTTVVKLRQFAELLSRLIVARDGADVDERTTLEETIRRLVQARIITGDAANLLHSLRKAGNIAVHEGEATYSDALTALKTAHQLGAWFHRTYGSDPTFKPAPFVPPGMPVGGSAVPQSPTAPFIREERAPRAEQAPRPALVEPLEEPAQAFIRTPVENAREVEGCLPIGSQADRIRSFAIEQWVTPARARGQFEVTIRAGDVHRDMGLSNALPAICSALGGNKFADLAGVALRQRVGPANGANVFFHFDLRTNVPEPPSAPTRRVLVAPKPTHNTTPTLDLSGALVLVSCVKSKLPYAAAARDLYTSAWFNKARSLVEASGAPWFILSSFYGLVAPDRRIAPYEYTLNDLGVADRRAWALKVLEQLLPHARQHRRVVMLAGARYREFLVAPLERAGIVVDAPLEHQRIGEQLGTLSDHE